MFVALPTQSRGAGTGAAQDALAAATLSAYRLRADTATHDPFPEALLMMSSRKNFRAADTIVRYGGDEFIVVMPETASAITQNRSMSIT